MTNTKIFQLYDSGVSANKITEAENTTTYKILKLLRNSGREIRDKATSNKVSFSLVGHSEIEKSIKDELNISEWVKKNCFTDDGRLNNRIIIDSWWINRGFENRKSEIFEKTSWLETNDFAQRIWHVVKEINEIPKCIVCGNIKKFRQYHVGYKKTCSQYCSTQDNDRNEKISSKLKENTERFEKSKITCFNRYSVEYAYQAEQVKEKIKATKIINHNDPNYNNPEKSKKTCLELYGVEYADQAQIIKDKISKTKIERYGHSGLINVSEYTKSKAEEEVRDFLKEMGYNFISTKTILENLELDGYCDELKMAFEYCGLYWHSDRLKKPNYHRHKYMLCAQKGIRLFTIFEDEWLERQKQVKQFLKAQIGVFENRYYARNCEFREIDKFPEFFELNHIQGRPSHIKRNFALINNNEVVGLVSYGNHHRNVDGIILNRLAFKDNVQVIGGATKLIKNSLNLMDEQRIVTWSDNRWSDGKIYKMSGFEMINEVKINRSYVGSNQKRYSNQYMNKNKTNRPENMTEREWAEAHGLFRIWDCGKKTWLFNKTKSNEKE